MFREIIKTCLVLHLLHVTLGNQLDDIRREIELNLPELLTEGFQIATDKIKAEEEAATNAEISGSSLSSKLANNRKTFSESTNATACRGLGLLETSKLIIQRYDVPSSILPSIVVPEELLPQLTPSGECKMPSGTVREKRSAEGYSCDLTYPYRSMNGECNNEGKGAANKPFIRFLAPDYGDGMDDIRGSGSLPNPRSLSLALSSITLDNSSPSQLTQMAKTWGQFLDHDVTLTAESKAPGNAASGGEPRPLPCCDDGTMAQDLLENCSPIDVSTDPFYTDVGISCLRFVRSLASTAGGLGAREQVNQITSFIDGSNVYSSAGNKMADLRTFNDGRLRENTVTEGICCINNGQCLALLPETAEAKSDDLFLAGDIRANEQPSLTSMHTVFLRLHNTLVTEYMKKHPSETDEVAFQEARRVVGAVIQHITYSEFLDVVLGDQVMNTYDLKVTPGLKPSFDSSVDPSIANVFTSAAYRFGHSLITDNILGGKGLKMPLNEAFFNNEQMMTDSRMHPSKVLSGECKLPTEECDVKLSPTLTNMLFADAPFTHGSDLMALNIKRGRDHGLPGYNEWREFCGLPKFNSFVEMNDSDLDTNVVGVFSQMYSNVDDVDLFPAGLAEQNVPGGIVGPTFACILGKQFQNLKEGDRFWYENDSQPKPFTEDQLAVIKDITLAVVLCEETTMAKIQRFPMKLPDDTDNPKSLCRDMKNKLHSDLDTFW